jgi:tRNA threonylcarbamoyladenosine biosynthesis protein TsaE
MTTSAKNTLKETGESAQKVAEIIKKGGLICLFGEIGSGKTTFTKYLAEHLGIEKFSVKSPTYTYIRKYEKEKNNIYHLDLYRLENIDELLLHEINELLENTNNIVIIEWADRLGKNFQKKRIDIYFEYIATDQRKIKIENKLN